MIRLSKARYLTATVGGSILGFILIMVGDILYDEGMVDIGNVIILIGIAIWIYSFVMWMRLIYRMWQSVQDSYARTTPAKAVGFLFIPYFNLYWIFQAWWGFAKDCNSYIERNQAPVRKLPEGLFLAVCILTVIWFTIFIAIIIGFFLVGRICDTINQLPQPNRVVSQVKPPELLGTTPSVRQEVVQDLKEASEFVGNEGIAQLKITKYRPNKNLQMAEMEKSMKNNNLEKIINEACRLGIRSERFHVIWGIGGYLLVFLGLVFIVLMIVFAGIQDLTYEQIRENILWNITATIGLFTAIPSYVIGLVGTAISSITYNRYIKNKVKIQEALKKAAVNSIICRVIDGNYDKYGIAITILGDLGDTTATEAVIKATESQDSIIRTKAAQALGKLKDARAILPLNEMLKDKDGDVRNAAKEALKSIPPMPPVPKVARTKEEKLIGHYKQDFVAKSEQELLKIWKKGDRKQYSEEELEAVRQILNECGHAFRSRK